MARCVVDAINALPDKVTEANAIAVSKARTAYNALTDLQKAYVTNLAKLEDAEYQIANPYTLGDVNNDGEISAGDALLALQHSVDKIVLSGNDFSAADVTNDGKVEADDALRILQYTVNKITSF